MQVSGLTCKHNAKTESHPIVAGSSQNFAGSPNTKLKGLSDKGINPVYPKRPKPKNNKPTQSIYVYDTQPRPPHTFSCVERENRNPRKSEAVQLENAWCMSSMPSGEAKLKGNPMREVGYNGRLWPWVCPKWAGPSNGRRLEILKRDVLENGRGK